MSKIEIKHRYTGAVLYAGEHETIKEAVEAAVKARADLTGANLAYANLAYANLTGADLAGADLTHANLAYADLAGANLTRANLAHADLACANLAYADLTRANLTRANLAHADLACADLARANLPKGFRVAHLCFGGWTIIVTTQHTTIGCQRHDNDKWLAWLPSDVAHMHPEAFAWWEDHGEAIKAVIRNVMQEQPKGEEVAK